MRIMITAPTTRARRMAAAGSSATITRGARARHRRSPSRGGCSARAARPCAVTTPPPRRRGASRPPVAMSRPDFLAVRGSRVEHGDQPAAIHHPDAVRELDDLVELGRDEEDRHAGVTLLDGALVDELDAADVEPARRLIEDEERQLAVELSRDHDLLLVAAGQRAGRHRRPTGCGCRTPRSPARRRRGPRRRCGPCPVRRGAGSSR